MIFIVSYLMGGATMTKNEGTKESVLESETYTIDIMTTNNKSLYKKINSLRADIIQCDWEGDKMISVGGGSYRYVSSKKVRSNFAPLLVKNGLEMDVKYRDLVALPSYNEKKPAHWMITLDVSLIDCDTGASRSYTVYGESSDMNDKGVAMVQTIALRQWILQEFLITDGFDPEDMGEDYQRNYAKKTPDEIEEGCRAPCRAL